MELTIGSIIELCMSRVSEPSKKIEKMYDWYFARLMEVFKWLLADVAAMGAAVVPVIFGSPIDPVEQSIGIASLFVSFCLAVSAALLVYLRMRQVDADYQAAMTIVGYLRPWTS